MAFRVNAYDADETNVNRIWDLEANRTSHLKKLQTIYKEREGVRTKSQKDHLKRQRELQKYHISKVKTFENKNKSVQDKINYENSLLRNKILDIYEKSNPYRKSKSFFINETDRTNPFKMNQAETMYRTNLKIGQRLTQVKSQIAAICKVQEHTRKSQKLLEMIQRKSPKKKAYLKSLTKKKFYADLILPELEENNI